MSDPRFPIGPFAPPGPLSPSEREPLIESMAALPSALRRAVAGLDDSQLDTPYREGGWTVRQVCHHVLDSQLNGYIRFKLGLTEERPTIKPYNEKEWARLPDAAEPVEASLDLFDALCRRWVQLLRATGEEAWPRQIHHPEDGDLRLDTVLALYVWHGEHHVAHITTLRAQRGW